MKVVINTCYGGLGLSAEALDLYNKLSSRNVYRDEIERDDPYLVQVVETLGKKANARYAELKVIEIPDGIDWHITDYDGIETIRENHRQWS